MNEKIGYHLKNLRMNKKASQEELALYVGVNKSTISKYERDLINPTLDIARKIADFFNISVEELANPKPIVSLDDDNKLHRYQRAIELADQLNISPDEVIKMIEFTSQIRK